MSDRILLVDDEEQIRKLLESSLQRRGYEVVIASDGIEALRQIRAKMPDLIVTDVNMPNMNGFELTRRLRADHRTARVPIVMLSARKQADDILTGYAEGADEYIAKPVEMAVLAAKIEVLIKRMKATVGEVTRRGRVLVFLRGKGGAGATTLAVNSAVALAETKMYKTAVLDLSLEFGNVASHLNLKPQHTLADLAETPPDHLDDAAFATFIAQDRSGVQVCVGSDTPERAELVTVSAVQQSIDRIRRGSDYLMVDTPPSFTQQTLAALDTADGACVVTEPHVASMKAGRDCLDVLDKLSFPKERVLFVVNRTTQTGLETDEVSRFFNRRPDIVVPFTSAFDDAADRGRPMIVLHPDNAASKQLRDLAARLTVLAPAGR
ncbi:MAG TPA: response regulator [Candidatus Limnocylindria bacterium]|nr:response regulator [Candidatus Limnocylindria bacterium]